MDEGPLPLRRSVGGMSTAGPAPANENSACRRMHPAGATQRSGTVRSKGLTAPRSDNCESAMLCGYVGEGDGGDELIDTPAVRC